MLEQLALLAAFSDVVKAIMYLVIIGSALMLIAVVLLQEGKGGGFGDAFGGMGTETFGARAGGVNKFTATIAAFFFIAILSVHLINRPPTPVEPEFDSAQIQPTNPQPSPLGGDPNSPFGSQFGNPDGSGMPGMPNTPQTPSLSPQQVAERQFQLFNSAGTGDPVSPMPFDGPAQPGPDMSESAPETVASNDPWSDPAWGLSPEEQAKGSLVPTPPPAPEATPEAAPAGGNE